MNTALHKTDKDLQRDVLDELKYEPSVNPAHIGVVANDGAITLSGHVSNYGEKWSAIRAAKRIAGVTAVADDITVQSKTSHSDTDIAIAAAHHLDWSPSVPLASIKATVSDGWLTLEGEVDWWYQKNAAEITVRNLNGVKGVTNRIRIRAKVVPKDVQQAIKAAFERNAIVDAEHITVETSEHKVTLRGKVRSYAEKEEAEYAALRAPGVNSVYNKLTVNWFS